MKGHDKVEYKNYKGFGFFSTTSKQAILKLLIKYPRGLTQKQIRTQLSMPYSTISKELNGLLKSKTIYYYRSNVVSYSSWKMLSVNIYLLKPKVSEWLKTVFYMLENVKGEKDV